MNPAGRNFGKVKLKPPFKAMRNTDYAGNFEHFLETVPEQAPFCFWLGTSVKKWGRTKLVLRTNSSSS